MNIIKICTSHLNRIRSLTISWLLFAAVFDSIYNPFIIITITTRLTHARTHLIIKERLLSIINWTQFKNTIFGSITEYNILINSSKLLCIHQRNRRRLSSTVDVEFLMQIYEQHICYVLTYGERDDMHYAMRQASLIVVVDFIGLVWSCLISMAMKEMENVVQHSTLPPK